MITFAGDRIANSSRIANLDKIIDALNEIDYNTSSLKDYNDKHHFLQKVVVRFNIIAPLYWWREFDILEVGMFSYRYYNMKDFIETVLANEFTPDNFSHEHLIGNPDPSLDSNNYALVDPEPVEYYADDSCEKWFQKLLIIWPKDLLEINIECLNKYRNKYLETNDKRYLWQIIQILPSSYNQKRVVLINYEDLAKIYNKYNHDDHILYEWDEFCKYAETLPYFKLIASGYKLSNTK